MSLTCEGLSRLPPGDDGPTSNAEPLSGHDIMITYDLRCDQGHRFEGWFRSREDYQAQCARNLIACPVCASTAVIKCPSAPNVRPDSGSHSEARDLREVIAQLCRQLTAITEDVGDRFAEEVRKIHYEETPHRPIRGIASPQEVEELAGEGIDVTPIPWPSEDSKPH